MNVILHVKLICYKSVLTSAFRTIEILAFSQDYIAAVKILCPPAPRKVNIFSLRCLTHWFVVFRSLLFLGYMLENLPACPVNSAYSARCINYEFPSFK